MGAEVAAVPERVNAADVVVARRIAIRAHQGQTYAGRPYFAAHVQAVAGRVANLGYGYDEICVAYLHDTVEDTDVTLADLAGRFPDHIVAAVDAITRRARPDGSKEGYFGEYLPRVLAVHLAAVAKRVDASCNLAQCVIEGNDSMAGRYRKVIAAVDTAYPDIARRCAASRHTGT